MLGNSYRLAGRPDDAIQALRAYHARLPGYGLGDIVMIHEQSGRLEEARETAAQLAAARPAFTVRSWLRTQSRVDAAQMAADLASLRAAGVPEWQSSGRNAAGLLHQIHALEGVAAERVHLEAGDVGARRHEYDRMRDRNPRGGVMKDHLRLPIKLVPAFLI